MDPPEHPLCQAIVQAEKASADLEAFKEQCKGPEDMLKKQQESLVAFITQALQDNRDRPLKTEDGSYVFWRPQTSRLTVSQERLVQAVQSITTTRLQAKKEELSKTTRKLTTFQLLLACLQDALEGICYTTSTKVAVTKRRPTSIKDVDARQAGSDVSEYVRQFLDLQKKRTHLRRMKQTATKAFRSHEDETQLAELVSNALQQTAGGFAPTKVRVVPAPEGQAEMTVMKNVSAAVARDAELFADLPQLPPSLAANDANDDDADDDDEESTNNKDNESVVFVPGLPSDVEMSVSYTRNASRGRAPKVNEFLAQLQESDLPTSGNSLVWNKETVETLQKALLAAFDRIRANAREQTAKRPRVNLTKTNH